jgi:hypothetical protein
MAENKKSVLLYCDIIHTVEKLDNETAGELFKHYLRYINDLNPSTDNVLVDVSFEPIKQNLKRDLKKWESRAERSRENGKQGGRPKNIEKPSGLIDNPAEPKKPVKDTVTVNVTDTVNVKVKDIKEERANKFAASVLLNDSYDKKMLEAFTDYWTESGENQKKLRFEFEKVFNIPKRLKTWYSRQNKFKGSTSNLSKHNVQEHADYSKPL